MDSTQGPPHWAFYFSVDDIDAAAARIVAGGGTVIDGPHQVPGDSWIVTATDPQGGHFALTGRRNG